MTLADFAAVEQQPFNAEQAVDEHNTDGKLRAHRKAMEKFEKNWKKHLKGFDFTVPVYREVLFLKELKARNLFYLELAETYVQVKKRKMGWIERLKKFNFKKDLGSVIVGVGTGDLVREDFIRDGETYRYLDLVCYSIAPTKELLRAREVGR